MLILACVIIVAPATAQSQIKPPIAPRTKVAAVDHSSKDPSSIRFATFNVSFHRKSAGELSEEFEKASSRKLQARRVAETLQIVRPDVVLLNEFDFDAAGKALKAFQTNYLSISQNGKQPIDYPHTFFLPVNTGVDSGIDLDGDGKSGTGNDAFGYGLYPGQYAMVVLSKLPINKDLAKSFQTFLWKDMPENLMPVKPGTDQPFYSAEATALLRLSSKSHWDVPIQVDGQVIHLLTAHPTPPVFDGAEDRNGRRNHDEIRLFADYVSPGKANYLYDDKGVTGGLAKDARFVIAGDMNADPDDGHSSFNAASQLTSHPLINHQKTPASAGGTFYAQQQGGKNADHRGDPKFDTGDFRDSSVGNLRLDYCLPSKNLSIQKSGVFWPTPDQPGAKLPRASDHRMVWIDIQL